MSGIRLDGASFTYPGATTPTIRDLSLTIGNGEAHALLGASGAGKTTLLNLLSGLITPTGGQILFDDSDVSSRGAHERNVALVFQFPVLYESMSIGDNLMFPLLNRGASHAGARSKAAAMAAELALADVLDQRPAHLPLYQKQLAAIGKALVREDVDLVLLDEPLTAVEPAIKWRLRQTLKRVQEAHGVTMIYVTHDQTEALTFADRVSVMSDGRIVQTDTPAAIHDTPATEFVGHFIGSPGMDFVPARVSDGRCEIVGAIEPLPAGVPDGDYTAGIRPEWIAPVGPGGPWHIGQTRLLGTRQGRPHTLVRLGCDGHSLHVRVAGDLPESARLDIRQCMLFDRGEAVSRVQMKGVTQ